jgi:hypothetical protein
MAMQHNFLVNENNRLERQVTRYVPNIHIPPPTRRVVPSFARVAFLGGWLD